MRHFENRFNYGSWRWIRIFNFKIISLALVRKRSFLTYKSGPSFFSDCKTFTTQTITTPDVHHPQCKIRRSPPQTLHWRWSETNMKVFDEKWGKIWWDWWDNLKEKSEVDMSELEEGGGKYKRKEMWFSKVWGNKKRWQGWNYSARPQNKEPIWTLVSPHLLFER